jgi:hypothetical protein
MALHPDMQRPGNAWLRAAFERSKLPRSGFADYMPMDNASVSRLLTGHRLLDPGEFARARGYFSIVPEGLPADVAEAIGELRAVKVRDFAVSELLRWFGSRASKDSSAESFVRLIEGDGGTGTLRADQIVAICRIESFDPRALTAGYGIQPYAWPGPVAGVRVADAAVAVADAAREWARTEGGLPYEFVGGRRSRPLKKNKRSLDAVRVAPVQAAATEFATCTAFAVLERQKLPFVPSREVYLAPPGTEVRSGDPVAVLRTKEADALFGTLSLSTDAMIVLELPDGKIEEVATGEGIELRRIAFCRI